MPRGRRVAPGGLVYHVLNRGVARLALFEKDADYEAFERVLGEAMEQFPTRLLSYCLMPNHWHLMIWPRKDGELTEFLRWLTHTHVMRWHAHYGTSGTGHLHQGRFKAFPMETDEHFYAVLRDVERNAQRANLVDRAEDWRWSSLWRRHLGNAESRKLLSDWPLPRPRDWLETVNRPQTDAEMKALRHSVQRGTPFGSSQWQVRTANRLGLEWTLRPRGRPRKEATVRNKSCVPFVCPFVCPKTIARWIGKFKKSARWGVRFRIDRTLRRRSTRVRMFRLAIQKSFLMRSWRS